MAKDMIGFFESNEGHKSMMRLIGFMSALLGTVILVSAIVFSFLIVFLNKQDFVSLAIIMYTAGGSLFGAAEGFKALQAKFEQGGGNG